MPRALVWDGKGAVGRYRRGASVLSADLAVIVALSLPTIQALAIWLAKRRIRSTDEQQLTFIRDVNGTITLTVRRDITTNDARPPDQSEIEAIGAQLRALLPSDPAGQ